MRRRKPDLPLDVVMDEVVGVLCTDFSMNVRKLDYYQSYYEDSLSLLLLILLLLLVVVVVVVVVVG